MIWAGSFSIHAASAWPTTWNPLDNAGHRRDISLADALSERTLAYAMSTITVRSLPDLRDGLKPVHR